MADPTPHERAERAIWMVPLDANLNPERLRSVLVREIEAAIKAARDQAVDAERARCARLASAWIHGAPTTTTEFVVKQIVEAIERGDEP